MLNFKIVSVENKVEPDFSELSSFQKIEQTLDYVFRVNINPTGYNGGLQFGYYYPNQTEAFLR